MLWNLKFFLNCLDICFSKAFFGCQSIARKVVKDRLMARVRPDIDGREFRILRGKVSSADLLQFDGSMAEARGNGPDAYSSSYRMNVIPNAFREVISMHYQEIEKFLGNGFLYDPPLLFRTLNMPTAFETYDVYSNIWHQDSHDGERLLKIFVCLMDVGDEDGPFMYLDRSSTLKNWRQLADRWDFAKISSMPQFVEQQRVVGAAGTYLIINTAQCMHRATIPKNYRDMMQLTLYPNWCQAADRKIYRP